MKKHLSIIVGSLFSLTSMAQETQEPFLVKQLGSDAIQHVKAVTSGGNISVAGVDASPRIEVFVRPSNGRDRNMPKEEIKKRLEENYDLEVKVENHQLTAIAKAKSGFRDWNRGLSISFKVYIPHNNSTDLKTSGGNISLTTLNGNQEFTTSGGNLDLDHLTGHINGKTSGGNITFTELRESIDLSTSGGNINASKSNGTLTLSTSGGALKLEDLKGTVKATTSGGNVHGRAIEGDLNAHTSGGNVDLQALACSLETSTSGGNIDVQLNSLGKFVKISNSGGNISLQVPSGKGIDLKLTADKVEAGTLSGFKGNVEKDRIDGSLNGGGIPVTVHGGSRINFSVK